MASSFDGPSPQMQRYYAEMSAARRRLVGPLAVFTAAYYLGMNFLANFTSWLDGQVFEGMTWAYVFGFSQMLMCAVVTLIYRRRIDAIEREFRPAELDGAKVAPTSVAEESPS